MLKLKKKIVKLFYYQTINIEDLSSKSRILFPYWALLIAVLIGYSMPVRQALQGMEDRIVVLMNSKDKQFTEENFRKELVALNVKNVDIVIAQAKLETGGFKSPIFKENNNCFGMKLATQRATTAIGIEDGHAVYASWRDCCIDYALYYNKYLSRLDREGYLQYLGQVYAEDSNYIIKIKQIIN